MILIVAYFFQNVQYTVPCATMRLNVINVHKDIILMRMQNVIVSRFEKQMTIFYKIYIKIIVIYNVL